MSVSKHLFKLAKTPLGDLIVGIAFGTPLSKLLPVKRVKETDKVLAFWHPKPFWQQHILLVPKKPIKSISSLKTEHYPYIEDIYKTAKEIVEELGWNKTEYTILTNGGNRQEVNQLHFHLNSGKEL
jgi:histidine triad (HIT) family protein